MCSGWRWGLVLPLSAGVAYAWPTYVRFFGVRPGPMAAGLLVACLMYLPSLWAIRLLDRHEPEPPRFFWGSIAFVILFAPITSRVMHAIIDGGLVPYWVIVGPLSTLLLLAPMEWFAVDLRPADPGAVATSVALVFAAVMNTLLVNVLLWPILAWGIRRSGRIEGGA